MAKRIHEGKCLNTICPMFALKYPLHMVLSAYLDGIADAIVASNAPQAQLRFQNFKKAQRSGVGWHTWLMRHKPRCGDDRHNRYYRIIVTPFNAVWLSYPWYLSDFSLPQHIVSRATVYIAAVTNTVTQYLPTETQLELRGIRRRSGLALDSGVARPDRGQERKTTSHSVISTAAFIYTVSRK